MAYNFISGPLLNILSRTASAGTPTPTADADYPIAQLYDGIPALPFKFGSASSDCQVIFDLNLLDNAGFETALSTSSTTGWVAATGTSMALSSGQANTGTYSLLVNGTAYHDVSVRPSESLKFEWAVMDSTSTGNASVQVQSVDLGQYLTSTGGWSSASTTYVVTTTAAGAWNTGSVTFSVAASTALLRDTATLRVNLIGVNAWYDDILLYPAVSWVSAHGHNWSPAVSPQVLGSSNSSTYTAVSTLSLYRDIAFGAFTATHYRYWKFLLSGTPGEAPYCGELVFGQYSTLLENPMYGSTVEYREKQVRKESPGGTIYVYNRGGQPVRTLKMTFYYSDSTQYYQSRRALLRASRGGEHPIVISASDMDVEQVIYGRITDAASYVKTDGQFWSAGYDVVEDALPLMSS